MKLDDIKERASAVRNGRWVPCVNVPGVRVRVRGIHNADYRNLWSTMLMSLPRSKRSDPDELRKISAAALNEYVLLEWEGIDDLPYTPENALVMLGDDTELGEMFRGDVELAAQIVADAGEKDTRDIAGNSAGGSNGTSAQSARRPPSSPKPPAKPGNPSP